jgi:aspartate-semialdehyde dehydrogenase
MLEGGLRVSNIVVVGATGAVGRELLGLLEDRAPSALRLCASERSVGKTISFAGNPVAVELARPEAFDGADVVYFCADKATSLALVPAAVERGCVVVDSSSAYRMDPSVPLVVPEVNGDVLDAFERPGIIANPNCSTIIALMAISPLRSLGRIIRITACTYQAISGAGAAAMAELEDQGRAWAEGKPLPMEVMGRQVVFNCFSHESPKGEDGMNEEERKLQNETRRILDDEDVRVSATCVRVPVLRAHSEALHIEFDRTVDPKEAEALLAQAPGVRMDPDPQPINAAGGDDVLVGRVRRDGGVADGRGLALFVCGDQLRKGAALNAAQIAARLSGILLR